MRHFAPVPHSDKPVAGRQRPPAVIAWPTLDDETRNRVTSLPIWDIAVQTEGRAGLNVKTFAERNCSGLLKEAVEMNAFEENRQQQVLANMVSFYGIQLQPEPEYEGGGARISS